MPWYEPIAKLVHAIDTEYDRRIRAASNIKAYHPEGGGHGQHTALPHGIAEEDAGGAGTAGALQGASGPQYAADPALEVIAQH